VPADLRPPRRKRHLERQAGAVEGGAQEVGGIGDEAVHIHLPALGGHAARDVEELGNDLDHARHLRVHDGEPARHVGAHGVGGQVPP
jgi:hypothetical protein